MLNKVILQGRLGRDPEKRLTPSGVPVTSVAVACDRDFGKGEKETDWIDVVAFRDTANFLSDHFQKGKMIIVSGRLQIRTWTDKDGAKRRNAEVVADSVYFGDSKKTSEGNPTYQPQSFPQASQNPYAETEALIAKYKAQGAQQSEFALLEDDDAQLPF